MKKTENVQRFRSRAQLNLSSNPPSVVSVRLSAIGDRAYEIYIRPGALAEVGSWIQQHEIHHAILLTDETVARIHLPLVESAINRNCRVNSIAIPPGEETKSIADFSRLLESLVALGTDRHSVLLALGGGVIGDLAGFVAASYARGIRFIQIPTTLLAQVDSSVGGKVGINLSKAKNMVGAFWQPQAVFIDPDVLQTLDERNYRAGLAEVVKYGMILEQPLFEFLESNIGPINRREPEVLTRVIHWCCQCKAGVVEKDERETSGLRALLNYGHTFGHAIESVFGYGRFLHGEAVAMGMSCAGRLAVELGLLNPQSLERQTKLLDAFGLPTTVPTKRHDELVESMKRDKKSSRGQLYLILCTAIGMAIQFPAPDDHFLLRSMTDRSVR